tara:strand:+ start:67 stop:225 length:159 start_codon:yes stop_codon:yes gene_type:complete
MTALPEMLKFQMGMKGGFNPVLVGQILLNWAYISMRFTKIGCMVGFLTNPIT